MTQANRQYGKRIRDICAYLDKHGPATSTEVLENTEPYSRMESSTYLRRAVGYGLADAVMQDGRWVYSLVPNWRDLLNRTRPEPIITAPRLTEWRFRQPWMTVDAWQKIERACL